MRIFGVTPFFHALTLFFVSLRKALINDRMASLLLENCVFSLVSKASTSFFGALNSISSMSSFDASFLGLVVCFLGTLLSPDLGSDVMRRLGEANNRFVVTLFKVVRKELL